MPFINTYIFILINYKWSEFLATDPEVPGSIPGASRFFWEAVGLERGPLSLVSTREYNWGATWKK
jgi:hypothetical protein